MFPVWEHTLRYSIKGFTMTRQQIQNRIEELDMLMFGLECSDDALFINANGNLPLYRSWEEEAKRLRGLL